MIPRRCTKLDEQRLLQLQNIRLQFTNATDAPLLASRRSSRQFGRSGVEVSDLFPNARFGRPGGDSLLPPRAFVRRMALNLNTRSAASDPERDRDRLWAGNERRNLPHATW
jgi:hypothetical protein